MEDDYFGSALNSLKKPQEKRRLLQILIAIKKGVQHDTTPNWAECLRKISEAGCTKNLLTCLQQENTNIVDITLSIIGNCCVDPTFARDSIKLNILNILNRVREKHGEDSVQGRVFRIVGNLCDNISSEMILCKEPALVDGIAVFLVNASKTDSFACQDSEASVVMAIRSIRKLLRSSTISKLVSKHNILGAVGSILLKYTRVWREAKKCEHVLQDILRLLHAISQYNRLLVPSVLIPLKGCNAEEEANPLMCLAPLVVLNPSRVVKIVLNFSRLCVLKSDLPIDKIWDNLLAEIKTTSSESVRKEYLRCMGDLADDPANREYLRLADNVLQLVSVLRNFTTCNDYTMDCASLILSILNKCHNDDVIITKQIQCGTITALMEKLEWICDESSCIVVPKHSSQKRKKCPQFTLTADKKVKSSPASPFIDTFPLYLDSSLLLNRCDSPSECSEISSNGPFSPSCAVVAEDVSDSDDYSPVCSEAEDLDVNALLPLGSVDADCIASSEDEDLTNLLPDGNRRMKQKLLDEITTLMLRYTRVKPVVMELGNPKLLIRLLNMSFQHIGRNSALVNIILSAARHEYLIPLMLTDFFQMIHDVSLTVHDATSCWSCYEVRKTSLAVSKLFSGVAESGVGTGTIAHQLSRADVTTKEKLVLSIPYVIRCREIISLLLLKHVGLEIFLKPLLGGSVDLRNKSVKALRVLAMCDTKVKNPVNSEKIRKATKMFDTKSLLNTCGSTTVTFKLDDGSSVKADRDFLSERSDYFNRLLCGGFRESGQSEIDLQNVTSKTFRCLLQLLQSDVTKMGVLRLNADLETVLGLLELTHRYLMLDLHVYLTDCLQHHITSKTAPIIYRWSIESGINVLRTEVIAFALAVDILEADRLIMFQNFFELGCSEQLVDDVQKILVQFLR